MVDGFYMLATTEKEQSFVGVRSMFYRLAMITGEGLLVMLAGMLLPAAATRGWPGPWRWAWWRRRSCSSPGLWHHFVLPRPA